MKLDQDYMRMALELAASALGKTNPNPVVGAVIVKDGVIVGTGLHRKAGEPHAEVHAFRMAGDHAKDATLYVTLEPCSHYGKTPPCALLVKESGVKRVVVATEDPNPQVAGRGINILREAGIEVEVGILQKEAQQLNERFIHNMIHGTPFVISKVAMTLDGKIATHTGHSQWITGEAARKEVHLLRNEVDGILVGIGTVLADNPRLTTRLEGPSKNPIRIILDANLRTPLEAHITDCKEAKTIIVTSAIAHSSKAIALEEKGVDLLTVPSINGQLDLKIALKELYKRGITDILLEGGSEVNASFMRQGLINKYLVYIAPKIVGGTNSYTPFRGEDIDKVEEAVPLRFEKTEWVGADIKITAYPVSNK
ncbi:bifunctional diaminohydroxyphosphoribosylaminopyrimidine deaminase/5-amino-6-(5-phosphoribosylamino)uracil reductase RibD [Cytobacillus oceanisediminis]|uniref:Riboflavin biosynthesis protein RibD n=1 Tax=Niallia alba TaxID=2729105 RepID=A0A7Y0KB04_9BACI|nr:MULTISPECIES: bifunctional diaminohydroxyphosphoribosylaminopyrimidine deaminase/5-amino-6-(5-phosphoribosylamino)uracil reductase RibD [Bacillaceae]EOR24278.1 riboflavin biosynthesis protein ribD [Niallia nealsonii AAU1]MBQ6446843.1 bifunctional diaminohydroxyphosphoribosylaminopyrimidine deaminase/5-amino-6-(5-phosphoribosylamino)uracil reductase RibD [Bacillus sp. (in: firmicutes)]MDU1846093.1 bifunctional diaminohydroxyphosphoribosylaminopyrimidine deaminase/5-amino-6-(5-phosphoribosylami